jgi:lycopene cyclase domain-containing protein
VIPDIGVLGPYTYLATEVAFGSIAAALLWYSGAWREAAITVGALYPVGYVWDWYTLEVGVFAIPLRTGLEFLGIPIEEHIFMIVVPAVVIGAHETIHGELLAESAALEDGDARREDEADGPADPTEGDPP